jgi:rubrerythrin
MMRRTNQLHQKRRSMPLPPKTENLSPELSHEHASIFFDSQIYICTTCGYFAERKEAVIEHIRRRLGQELLGKEPTVH